MNRCLSLIIASLMFLLVAGCDSHDPMIPDTKDVRESFKGFFGIDPADQVSGIYYYYDMTWPDPVHCFVFSASKKVVEKIVAEYKLGSRPNDYWKEPYEFPRKLTWWWKPEERKNARFYELREEKRRCDTMLWYDESLQKCHVAIIYH